MNQNDKAKKTTTTTLDARKGERHGCPSKADTHSCGSVGCNAEAGVRGPAFLK